MFDALASRPVASQYSRQPRTFVAHAGTGRPVRLLGRLNQPIHALETGAEVRDIVNVAVMAVIDVQTREYGAKKESALFHMWPMF